MILEITKELLDLHGACESGTKFATMNNLIGRTIDTDLIDGDYDSYVDFIVDSSPISVTYDESGRIIKSESDDVCIVYDYTNTAQTKTITNCGVVSAIETFDLCGNLTSVKDLRSSYETQHIYNEHNQKIESNCIYNGRLIRRAKRNYTFGLETKYTSFKIVDGVETDVYFILYTYDNKNRIIKESTHHNGNILDVIHEYNDIDGLHTVKDSTGVNVFDIETDLLLSRRLNHHGMSVDYEYDDKHNITKMSESRHKSETVVTEYEYTFDKHGTLMKIIMTYEGRRDTILSLTKAILPIERTK